MFGGPQSFAGLDSQSLTMGSGLTPSQPEAKKGKVEEKQQILPVTIRAIEMALAERLDSASELRFHGGAEPSSLLLVAMVESVLRQPTSLELSLNDGTGRFKARYFVSESLPDSLDHVQPGRYVSVVGSVRATPVDHLGLLCLRPVESADEISYHLIECAHAALRIKRGQQDTPKSAESWTPQSKLKSSEAASLLTPTKEMPSQSLPMVIEAPAMSPSVSKAAGAPLDVPLRDSLDAVLRREAEAKGEVGVSVTELLSLLGAAGIAATESKLRTCLAEMTDNGEVFNTLDDDHFAPI